MDALITPDAPDLAIHSAAVGARGSPCSLALCSEKRFRRGSTRTTVTGGAPVREAGKRATSTPGAISRQGPDAVSARSATSAIGMAVPSVAGNAPGGGPSADRGRIEHDVLDSVAHPRVGDVDAPVAGLDHGR